MVNILISKLNNSERLLLQEIHEVNILLNLNSADNFKSFKVRGLISVFIAAV